MLNSEIKRFLVVGIMNVFIDSGVYFSLLWLGFNILYAKAIAFIIGTLFAFIANRSWTFNVLSGNIKSQLIFFFALYGFSLLINVGINSNIASLLDYTTVGILVAYICATILSAMINFLGMRQIFTGKYND
jgi:putative flippase GtrA